MKLIVLEDGADLDALSSALAVQKLWEDAILLKPRYLSKRSALVFKKYDRLFRTTETQPRHFDLVILDTAQVPERAEKSRVGKLIRFDHHPGGVAFEEGRVEKTGACTTLVVEELIKRDRDISEDEATVIALGIYEDTGGLTYEGTTWRDAEALSWLLRKGARLREIREILTDSYTEEHIEVVRNILSSLEKVFIGNLQIAIATAITEDYQPEVVSLLYEIKDFKEADAFFLIVEAGGKTYVFGRSQSSEIDAGRILSEIGGGGHPEAGALKLEGVSAERIKSVIKRLIAEESPSGFRVRDIMSSPPFYLRSNTSVEEGLRELSLRGFANAPVLDEEGRIVGIVSKKALLKLSKLYPSAPVEDFANRDFHTLEPDDPVWEGENLLSKFSQKMIPVVEEGKLKGVITRLDILQTLKGSLSSLKPYRRKVQLPTEVSELAEEVGEIAGRLGLRAFLVGGVVRDLILGREVFDLDFVVEGDAIEVARLLAKRHGVEVHPFPSFGTAHIKIGNKKIEFATTRRETYPRPGAYPRIEPSSIKEDLIRRDFTINAMAISVNSDDFGTLIDYFGGFRDIKEKKIRVLHPLSFIEDPVRILRALRFAGRLGFSLSKNTHSLLTKALKLGVLNEAPKGRIATEIRLALTDPQVSEILKLYKKYRVLEQVIEGFSWNERLWERVEALKRIIDWHSVEFPQDRLDYGWIYLIALLENIKPQKAEEFLKDVSAPSWVRENLHYIHRSKSIIRKLSEAEKPSRIYNILQGKHTGLLLYLMTEEEVREKVRLFIEKLRNFKLEKDEIEKLKGKGLEGRALGKAVEELKKEKMDRELRAVPL